MPGFVPGIHDLVRWRGKDVDGRDEPGDDDGVEARLASDRERQEVSMSDTPEILEQAAAWRGAGRKVALATVVTTWGSSPRPVGSKLAVDEAGKMIGSVSGGCIEGAVVDEAMGVMRDGKPRLLDFGVTNEMAWEVGLACGGKVQVFVERLD